MGMQVMPLIIQQMLRVFLLTMMLFSVSSCIYLTRSDISADSRYKDLIGSIFTTNSDMKLLRSYGFPEGEPVEFHTIMLFPGAGGPEIDDLGVLPKGTMLKITKVIRESPNITLRHGGVLFVAELLSGRHKGLEVDISSNYHAYEKLKGSTQVGLNPKFFLSTNKKNGTHL